MKIRYRSKEKVCFLKEHETAKEKIENVFLESDADSIYIIDRQEKVIGIITQGNFSRNIRRPQLWITYSFIYIEEPGTIENAEEILSKKRIQSVAVLNGKGNLVGEYYRDDAYEREIWRSEVRQLFREIQEDSELWNPAKNMVIAGEDDWSKEICLWFCTMGQNAILEKEWDCISNSADYLIITPYYDSVKRLRMKYEGVKSAIDVRTFLESETKHYEKKLVRYISRLKKGGGDQVYIGAAA